MAIQHTIYPEQKLVLSTWRGAITDDSMLPPYRALYSSPEWQPGLSELLIDCGTDVRGVSVFGLRRFLRTMSGFYTAPFQLIIVTPADLHYGLARMYQVFAGDGPPQVRVTRKLSEALHWLSIDPTDIDLPLYAQNTAA